MDDLQKLSLTALAAINGIGTVTVCKLNKTLIKHKISWDEFWVLKSIQLEKIPLNKIQIDGIIKFKKEHSIYSYSEMLRIRGIRAVMKDSPEYPPLLKRCNYAPLLLFAKGAVRKLQSKVVIAVVGTRDITAYGRLVTKQIVTELTQVQAVIVSGCMYGVDLVAHQTAINQNGETIGVLGYGFDYYYPAQQQRVMEILLSQGMTFYTPFAPHIAPKKGLFPARNRIVAGMSQAVVVTEAAEKSGSHITAEYAADEGRVVCAVPGPITNPYSAGTKSLINQGAVLVTCAQDILQECNVLVNYPSSDSSESLTQELSNSQKILKTLNSGALSIDEMITEVKLQYSTLLRELTLLELSGKIKKEGTRWNIINLMKKI